MKKQIWLLFAVLIASIVLAFYYNYSQRTVVTSESAAENVPVEYISLVPGLELFSSRSEYELKLKELSSTDLFMRPGHEVEKATSVIKAINKSGKIELFVAFHNDSIERVALVSSGHLGKGTLYIGMPEELAKAFLHSEVIRKEYRVKYISDVTDTYLLSKNGMKRELLIHNENGRVSKILIVPPFTLGIKDIVESIRDSIR